MSEKNKKIDFKNVTEQELEVLYFLEKKENCLYGNIFKELNIATTKGADIMLSLSNKGYIKNMGRSSYYEINVSLK
jgi:predicted transcriptional regulator